MRVGKVILIGRPNAGKSTLINNIIGKKISITSTRPQTTRKIIQGVYWDERGQIIFLDTPGIFAKIKDPVAKKISGLAQQELSRADVVVYLVDRSRSRGEEENRILGVVRKTDKPKIIAINKIDLAKPNHIHEYQFLEDEFDAWIEISALKRQHLKTLLEKIFEFLPEGKPIFDPKLFEAFPALNVTPDEFVAEIIREKAFNTLYEEIPYTIGVKVKEIKEQKDLFYIKAAILTTNDHYKPMIIGRRGKRIKEIGQSARKELETITGKQVFLDLVVVSDPHWIESE